MRGDDAAENKMMHASEIFPVARALVVIFVLWGGAFTIACRLASAPERQHAAGGIVARLLGSIRGEVGGRFYQHADTVFHRGIGPSHPVAFSNWFVRMKNELAPSFHGHLKEDGVLDIMPWLFFAARTDAGNSDAYIVAAFWLAMEAGRPELAEQVLNEAARNNPSDYRVYLEKGKLAMKLGKYGDAAWNLDAAIKLWPGAAGEHDDDAKYDRGEMLIYRGLLHEIERNPEKALACYREELEKFPGRLQVKERMAALEKNGCAPVSPEDVAKNLLLKRRFVCSAHEHEHEHE